MKSKALALAVVLVFSFVTLGTCLALILTASGCMACTLDACSFMEQVGAADASTVLEPAFEVSFFPAIDPASEPPRALWASLSPEPPLRPPV